MNQTMLRVARHMACDPDFSVDGLNVTMRFLEREIEADRTDNRPASFEHHNLIRIVRQALRLKRGTL